MSQRNALRNPRRTGATAAALMVGLALVGGMSVASASMTKSFDEQIDKTLGADFVVQNATSCRSPQEVTEKVRDTEGVGLVVRQRFAPVARAAAGREAGRDDRRRATTTAARRRRAHHVRERRHGGRAGRRRLAMDADFARGPRRAASAARCRSSSPAARRTG